MLNKAPAFPSASALWGRWIPPLERSIIPPIASSGEMKLYDKTLIIYICFNLGKEIGIVITTIIVSQLCSSTFLGGWPSAFYVFGK